MKIIKPSHLELGDTIGIISPSFPKPNEHEGEAYREFELGLESLREMGFKVKEGKNLGKVHWWSGGTVEERAQDINDFFTDDSVKAIMAHDGGGGALQLLDKLDYGEILKHPKPLIGFSDITNLHLAIFTQTGLVGFQGPMSTYNFGLYSQQLSVDEKELEKNTLFQILTSSNKLGNYPTNSCWDWWKQGSAQGMLFGGNLSMVSSLVGTKYFPKVPDLRGCIFYFEVDNVTRYHLERSMYQLKYLGLLKDIGGMIIGRTPGIKPSPWGFENEPSIKELVMSVVGEYDFPILSGFQSGHEGLNLTLPIGAQVEINSENNNVTVLEGVVT